jgi:ribonuclease BN (tRNA processing enzyme)
MKRTLLLAGIVVFSASVPLANHASAETTLITLGTAGGPLPQAKRAQSSNLLIVNGTLYLIDAGGGVTGRIVQSGNNFRQVSKIFITHLHSDHDDGLATLLNSQWEQQSPPVDIYGGGVEALVKGAIAYLQPNADIRWSEGKKRPMAEAFRAHDIMPGVVYQDANVKVTAAENSHFHFQPGDPAYGKYRSYSYRFETPDKVVFFTGDTGPSDIVVDLAKGADLYVTETTKPEDVVELYKRNGTWQEKTPGEQEGFLRHMHEEHVTPEDIGKMATKAGVKAVILSHYGPSLSADDDFQRLIDETKKFYSGPVTLAKDLMKF